MIFAPSPKHRHPYSRGCEQIHLGIPPKHRAGSHRRDCAPDWVNTARCTGGLVNEYGKRLTHCRSSVCPHHAPADYASHMAKHAPESFKTYDNLGREIRVGD